MALRGAGATTGKAPNQRIEQAGRRETHPQWERARDALLVTRTRFDAHGDRRER